MKSRSVGVAVLLSWAAMASGQEFTTDDALEAVQAAIEARSQGGVYTFKDPRADTPLALELDKVRLARQIHGYGFFVDVDFRVKGEAGKAYDLDFWLKPSGAKLEILDVRVHKAPKRDGDTWKLVTRSPIPWWWIPATEHPGETEEKRGWQIESALHEHLARQVKDGVYSSKDDKTGQERLMEFVEIHKPLRKVEGKGFFACTDFKEKASDEKFYDIDFWLVEKDGKLEVSEVKIHKEPKLEDGVWVQTPRYDFEKDKVKEIP